MLIPEKGKADVLKLATPYVLAVLAVASVAMVRWLLDPILRDQHGYVLFIFPALVLANSYGWKPALLALVLGMMTANYFFLKPRLSFYVEDSANQVGLLIYLVVGGAGIFLAESRRCAQKWPK